MMPCETLETGSLPTREYLDYMCQTDVGMKELRTRMTSCASASPSWRSKPSRDEV